MNKIYPHKKLFDSFNQTVKSFLSFLFPPRCVRCQKLGIFLCDNCRPALPRSDELAEGEVLTVFDYRDQAVKRAIHHLKYRGVMELAEIFADELYQTFITAFGDQLLYQPARGKIAVVPVPLSRQKKRERGFNQAEELARHFCAFDPKNFELRTDLVFKIKNTTSQVACRKRSERLSNLRGAFAAGNRKKLAGKTILIVDDVVTTGATIGEVKKILAKNGAKRIFTLAVAHG